MSFGSVLGETFPLILEGRSLVQVRPAPINFDGLDGIPFCELALLPIRSEGSGAKIIGVVHDEILLEAPEDDAEETAAILKNTMIEAGSEFLKKVPIEVDVTISDSWAEQL